MELSTSWAGYTATSSSVGGTNMYSNDREVVDLTGWGTFGSSEVVSGLIMQY